MKHVPEGDEFYGVEFSQVSDEGVREVLSATYALMTWWKVRMNNEDSIDISDDSMSSMLRFQTGFEARNDVTYLEEGDEIEFDSIIEVDEARLHVSLYTYVPKPIPDALIPDVFASLIKINPHLTYGHFEAYKPSSDDGNVQFYLRYKVTTLLQGVKVGKVDVIDTMTRNAQENVEFGIDLFAADCEVKCWLTDN